MKQARKPRIGVSQCLIGDAVCYDGGHKFNSCVVELLAKKFELHLICPEMGAGLGTPRPPIQLVQNSGIDHAVVVDNHDSDVTAAIEDYCQSMYAELQKLSGYVFKSRSPSCGINDVPLYDDSGMLLQHTSGIFCRYLMQHFPQIPVIDEMELGDEARLDHFIKEASALHEKMFPGEK